MFIQLRDEIVGDEEGRQVWLECSVLEPRDDGLLYLCTASDEWKRLEVDAQGDWCIEGHDPFPFCFIRAYSGGEPEEGRQVWLRLSGVLALA